MSLALPTLFKLKCIRTPCKEIIIVNVKKGESWSNKCHREVKAGGSDHVCRKPLWLTNERNHIYSLRVTLKAGFIMKFLQSRENIRESVE